MGVNGHESDLIYAVIRILDPHAEVTEQQIDSMYTTTTTRIIIY